MEIEFIAHVGGDVSPEERRPPLHVQDLCSLHAARDLAHVLNISPANRLERKG